MYICMCIYIYIYIYKFRLYKCRTPAALSTFSRGRGLPTLGCLCKALPRHRTSTETNRCLAKGGFGTYSALWYHSRDCFTILSLNCLFKHPMRTCMLRVERFGCSRSTNIWCFLILGRMHALARGNNLSKLIPTNILFKQTHTNKAPTNKGNSP